MNISVVIATYNRAASLKKTLDSLANQQFNDLYEVIVVDDGSRDETLKMLAEYNQNSLHLRFFSQENKGPAAARNVGISKASYGIIAFTDDDCIVHDDWLQTIAIGFENPAIVGQQGSTYTYNHFVTPTTHQIDNINGNPSVPTCNASYRTEALIKAKGFDEAYPHPHNEDADLAWRIEKDGLIQFNSKMLVCHPPRKDKFLKVARRMKILESEFRLYYKNSDQYKKYRGGNPWKVIYFEIMVKTLGYYMLKRIKDIRKPYEMVVGVSLIFIWFMDLILRLPDYQRENKISRLLIK